MLLFWDGASDPTGWSCVSCTSGDDFYQKFIRGESTYGGTGGAVTHTHTASGSVDATTTPMPARSRNPLPNDIHENTHAHTFSPSIGSSSNLPSHRQLKVIRHDTAGDVATLPAGAIALFDATVPAGWTRYSAQDGYYPYGENTVGTTGGSNTHGNAITGTASAATGGDRERNVGGAQTDVADGSHTHDGAGTAPTTNNEPPYIEMIMGELDSDASPPNDMYAMWDDDPTSDWSVKSDSGGALYQTFFKGAATYGATGGATTHTHTDTSYASGGPSATTTSRSNGTVRASDDTHTHTLNVTGFSTDNHLPPYVNVIIAKKQEPSTLDQSAYRWFANSNSTDVGSALAAQDTAASAPPQGTPFRLRFLVHVTGADYAINGESLKLQFAERSGTCDTSFIGETYADVATGSGAIRYYDNTTPSDNTALTTNASDPTHSAHTVRAQTYEEGNNFVNSQAAVSIGEDGLWDVALVDNSASTTTTYCFRVVRSAGSSLDAYSVIPEITTDDGLGHMLLFWDSGAAPTGWSCVSCNSGEPFYQRFVRGEANYGASGGSATHTHTASATVGNESVLSGRSNAGTGYMRGHTHTATPSIAAANNLPSYRQLNIIRYDTSGTPSTIPNGAIAIFDAAVPAGWTRYGAQDGAYIRGENTAGTTGGSNTHTNGLSGTTSGGSGIIRGQNPNNTQGPASADTHTHTFSGNTDSVNNEPPYVETILGKINADGAAPTNILAMWDGSFPSSWTSQSGSGGAFHQVFMKPAATFGTTGGSATHSHGTANITSTAPSATAITRTGGTNLSSGTHTHNVAVDTFSTDSHLPPYINTVIAKLTGTNTAPNTPTLLDQIRVSDTVSIAVGGFANSNQVEFTASASDTDNPDDLQLCIEVQQVGTAFTNAPTQCGSAVTYSGTAVAVDVTIATFADATNYHWQAQIKDGNGATSAWLSFGANAESATDFTMDSTDPDGTVFDGTSTGVDVDYNAGELDELSANWNVADAGSGVTLFEYSIGTASGAIDVLGWTGNGTTAFVTATSLTLQTGQPYFINVRTTDGADNQSITSSDSQLVAPTLGFSSSSGSVIFDNLNSGNSFTSTKTTTLTTSTNAYNGYIIRAFATGVLTSPNSDTVGFFDGGTYASPDEWLGADRGYGYTSNDTTIQGSNKFSPGTCAGGGSPPCYAPFSTTGPGDIVADHTSTISGAPVINENFIITHRVTTDATQEAGTYTSEVTYVVTTVY